MTAHQAAARWQKRQAQTLAAAYLRGWRAGVRNFQAQPPPGQQYSTPLPPPAKPAAAQMAKALGPALVGLARIAAQIALVPAGAAQTAVLVEFLKASAYRLALGASVAWTGEQAGYSEASNASGLLLKWQLDGGSKHCADCPALAQLPPMALSQWPTMPGDGGTECAQGCKCSMSAVDATPPALTGSQLEVLSRVGNRQPVLAAA